MEVVYFFQDMICGSVDWIELSKESTFFKCPSGANYADWGFPGG
jgi:hypothetical protein